MDIWKFLLRLWALLTLVSLAIDGACVWIDAHGGTQPFLDAYGVNYISVFLWSAAAPFALAVLVLIFRACLATIGWIARICVRPRALPIEETPRRRYGAAARRDAA